MVDQQITKCLGGPIKGEKEDMTLTRRAHARLIINDNRMAWRPYENLIEGELDNRTPGNVTGWLRFLRLGKKPLKVTIDLKGDFHEDIRGRVIRLRNSQPSDYNETLERKGTFMEGFSPVQRGTVGDITAGLSLGPWTKELAQNLMAENEIFWDREGFTEKERKERRQECTEEYRKHIEAGDHYYAYVDYPYVEWFSEANGRVVLELDPSQVEVLNEGDTPRREKTPEELAEDKRKRSRSLDTWIRRMVRDLTRDDLKRGGDGNVTGYLVEI